MNSLQSMKTLRWITAALATAILAGCSGGGAPTVQNPITQAPPVSDYTGPASANADVLVSLGIPTVHIRDRWLAEEHRLGPPARLVGGVLAYSAHPARNV